MKVVLRIDKPEFGTKGFVLDGKNMWHVGIYSTQYGDRLCWYDERGYPLYKPKGWCEFPEEDSLTLVECRNCAYSRNMGTYLLCEEHEVIVKQDEWCSRGKLG